MITFKELRSINEKRMKPETEEAILKTLFWLAKKGTTASIKTGRAIVKAFKATSRYFTKKIVAVMIPGLGISELQKLTDMGFNVPGYHPLGSNWDNPDYSKRFKLLYKKYYMLTRDDTDINKELKMVAEELNMSERWLRVANEISKKD